MADLTNLQSQLPGLNDTSTALQLDINASADPSATVKTPSVTNPSETDIQYANAFANANNIDFAPLDESSNNAEFARLSRSSIDYSNESVAENARLSSSSIDYSNESAPENARLSRLSVSPGAEPKKPAAARATFNSTQDFRPRLVVPSYYLSSRYTAGPGGVIKNSNGIIFPYTPNISQDYNASYSSVSALHSNYALNFYKNSAPGDISITAKLTVQNETDAHFYLSVIHLLRGLIKMRFGTDPSAGAPPPVCRLFAYGGHMFDNIPVSIKTFQIKLDDSIDYFTLTSPILKETFGANTVPSMTTITLSLIPMYSRAELMQSGVNDWLHGDARKTKGYV